MSDSALKIIPPLSIVKVTRVTADEPDWFGYEGRIFRTGYYRRNDGLNCVWLVDDSGDYGEAVDQHMIQTHFEIIELSDENDLFGVERPVIGPRNPSDEDLRGIR